MTPSTASSAGRNPAFLVALLFIVLAPLAYLLFYVVAGAGGAMVRLDHSAGPVDFTATTLDGRTVRLSSLRGQPVVLNFWASWCPPCRAEAPDFERVHQAYRDKGVVILGVNTSDQTSKAQAFLTETGVSYPNLLDDRNQLATQFNATSLPTTIFIDREGHVVKRRLGAINAQQLATQIDDLLR